MQEQINKDQLTLKTNEYLTLELEDFLNIQNKWKIVELVLIFYAINWFI